MIPKSDNQTMQPAQHLKKNMIKKATKNATPVAAKSQCQLFLISLMKSARAPWFRAFEKLELIVLNTVENMLEFGTQALPSTEYES